MVRFSGFLVSLFAALMVATPAWAEESLSEECPLDNAYSSLADGRGPSEGPLSWYLAPEKQPEVADNPLSGKEWFVDCQWDEAWIGSRARIENRQILGEQTAADALSISQNIARYPIAKWIGPTLDGMYETTRRYLVRTSAQAPGAVRFIVFRKLEKGNCRPYQKPDQSRHGTPVYKGLVREFSQAVRDADEAGSGGPVVLIIEPDIMASMRCIPGWARANRIQQIRYAVDQFKDLPGVTTYVDAGASDWMGWKTMARYLKMVGINKVRGFSLNATHYDWTRDNVAYGNRLASNLGVHFVVSTGRAGGGQMTDYWKKRGYDAGCNIPNAGLGFQPTVRTHSRLADAYLWLVNPGFSDGNCYRGPNYRTASVMWSDFLAKRLIRQRCQSGERCYGRGRLSFNS